LGFSEDRLNCGAYSEFEASVESAALVVTHKAFEIFGCGRPAESFRRQTREDLPDASVFITRPSRLAGKDFSPAATVGYAGRIEWAGNRKCLQVWQSRHLGRDRNGGIHQRLLHKAVVILHRSVEFRNE